MTSNSDLLKNLQEIATGPKEIVSQKYHIPPNVLEKVRTHPRQKIINPNYPYPEKMGRSEYEKRKRELQVELIKMHNWMRDHQKKVIIIFEGRDAAGKGGAIKRFTEHLNPRRSRVVALEKPSEVEKGQWYFQRYIDHLPSEGEIVFFDRSWYNRAGVEKVMGFCSEEEYRLFLQQAPDFEEMLINSGIIVFKFWFSVSREEQIRRFIARTNDPLKQWKLSPMDLASLSRWEHYTKAKEEMFKHTDIDKSPWTIIRSDDKKRARLNAIRYVLDNIPYQEKSLDGLFQADDKIIGRGINIL